MPVEEYSKLAGAWSRAPLVLLTIILGATQAGSIEVAAYRAEFQSGSLPPGWTYLWNANGAVGNPANYVPLQPDGTLWDTDASNPGLPDAAPGSYLHLSATGGHPGNGYPDCYAIAAFTVAAAGEYAISNSFLSAVNGVSGGSLDGIQVCVHVNDGPIRLLRTVGALDTIDFDVYLGALSAGDIIYVGVGENGTHDRDAFAWDFMISDGAVRPAPGTEGPGVFIPAPAGPSSPPAGLEIYGMGHPRAFFFRVPEGKAALWTYDRWDAAFRRLGGINTKGLREELDNLNGSILPYLQHFAFDHPAQVLIEHFNGIGMVPTMPESTNFSHGHWAYLPGAILQNSLDPSGTNVVVSDGSRFRLNVGTGGVRNDDIVIVPLDSEGNKVWGEAEQAVLLGKSGNTLTVARGQYRSAPRSFSAEQAWVAPHASTGPWGDPTLTSLGWMYNFSTLCPTNSDGKTCADVMVDVIHRWFSPGGPLERFHGIQFDIGWWSLNRTVLARIPDLDNDGIGEGGILGGEDQYAIGIDAFYRVLRSRLGTGRIIAADGGRPDSQRSVGVLDGIETEGLAAWNDPYFKEWSSNLNRFEYWKRFAPTAHPFNYVNQKEQTLSEHPFNTTRLGLATASSLAVFMDYVVFPTPESGEDIGIWDELKAGTDQKPNWLGECVGPYRRLGLESPDLLGGIGVTMVPTFVSNLSVAGGSVSVSGAELIVSGGNPAGGSLESITLTYPGILLGAGDLLVRFEARGSKLANFPADVPRQIKVTAPGRLPSANTADAVYGFAGSSDWSESVFYFRDAGPSTVDLSIDVEGRQDLRLRGLTVHQAADLTAREFEGGVILCNPSTSAQAFDTGALFPGWGVRRLTGSTLQDPATNDGSDETDRVLMLPALDALFLKKGEIDTDDDGLPDWWERRHAPSLATLGGAGGALGPDFDFDGECDLVEFLFGSDPAASASRPLLNLSRDVAGALKLKWGSQRLVEYTILTSEDLRVWEPLPGTLTGNGGALQQVIDPAVLGHPARIFFRLDATHVMP